jgi:hypothetical protein
MPLSVLRFSIGLRTSWTIENHYFSNTIACVALCEVELKNELGIPGEDGLQAALLLHNYVAQVFVELLPITFDLPRH